MAQIRICPSELLLLNNPLLTVERNSEVRARPWRLSPRWLEDARPDATLGLKAITEHADVAACATGRISFSFADIEEKRSKDDNKDESKLLVIMGIRLWHLQKAIPSTHLWEMMDNGIPLYVSVGVLRSAVSWFVYFMWRELEPSTEKPIFRWSRLLDGPSLSTPEGFLHYTTFMWCLSVYGGLFARAVRKQLRARKEVIKSHESTSAQDDQRDGDDGDDGDDDDGDGDDGDGGAKERKSVGDRSGSSGSSKDQRDRNASGDTVTDLTDAVLLSKGGGIEVVLGRAPGSGELLVRKTMETFIDINNTNEFKAYMILQGKGLAPRLLDHRSYGEDYVELDLEYLPPYTINPRDGSEMKLYARGLLQALAGIHELGLMHLDIKSDNIIVSHVDGKGLQVKLIDFEFSLTPGSSPDDVVCCGTPGYCAPEISQAERDRDYTAVLRNGGAADVFAAGLVLLEDLLDIQYLYDHQRESEALTAYLAQLMAEDLSHKERCARLRSKLKALKMKRGKRPPVVLLGEEAGAMALDLVHKLTQHSVSARYTAAQALAHPFVADAVPHHRSISL